MRRAWIPPRHSGARAQHANPESSDNFEALHCNPGFRVRHFVAPRNDRRITNSALSVVMPGFMPSIHVLLSKVKTWMAGPSPAMTDNLRHFRSLQTPCDQQLHDLVGPRVDAQHARVAVEPRNRIFVHVTIA